MPTTRRSAASAKGRPGGPAKGQMTISFSNRVTKAVPKDVKSSIVDSPATTKIPERPASAVKEDEPSKEEKADVLAEEPEPEVEEPEEEEEEEEEEETEVAPVPEKTEAELKAEKITDAQVNAYWKGVEKLRKAPRVHQEDLDVSEKVLRYFDVSSQYGPCIGMPRLKRWQRADRLGLNPPIEVLAVLLKEENLGHSDIESAYVDRIMNAAALPA